MPIFKLKLIDRKTIATNTVLFHFEKPANFSFIPGQYGGFTLINPAETDAGGITRRFSLLSTPDDPHLAIAMRVQTSAYKRVLSHLALGEEVKFAGPTGNFVLPDDLYRPVVLIAGGIGITPFYSMINFATRHQPQRKIFLFYGNRSIADTAFLEELVALQTQNPNFKFICAMEKSADEWHGELGYITHTLLKKHLSDINVPTYFICGAPVMVTALQEILAEMGIDERQIQVEDFPGY